MTNSSWYKIMVHDQMGEIEVGLMKRILA